MAKVLSSHDARDFMDAFNMVNATIRNCSYAEKLKAYRACFFEHFRLSDMVPASLVPAFIRFAERFYDRSSTGYNGIMEEIKERVLLYADIDGFVYVREFLKHGAKQTDIYDKENRVSYEKKTGTGDWLRSERCNTLEETVMEYRRKKTRLLWDYDFTPISEDMAGKKSVNNNMTEEEKRLAQERTKTKKDGSKVVNKQYAVHIHINTTYKKFFDYLETYPSGLKTFFKESSRSGVAGVYVWELQTIKNSRKKIEFLEHFETWEKTGKSLSEWKEEQENKE